MEYCHKLLKLVKTLAYFCVTLLVFFCFLFFYLFFVFFCMFLLLLLFTTDDSIVNIGYLYNTLYYTMFIGPLTMAGRVL